MKFKDYNQSSNSPLKIQKFQSTFGCNGQFNFQIPPTFCPINSTRVRTCICAGSRSPTFDSPSGDKLGHGASDGHNTKSEWVNSTKKSVPDRVWVLTFKNTNWDDTSLVRLTSVARWTNSLPRHRHCIPCRSPSIHPGQPVAPWEVQS